MLGRMHFAARISGIWDKISSHLINWNHEFRQFMEGIQGCPQFIIFRPWIYVPWVSFLVVLLAFGIFIITVLNRNQLAEHWNYAIPLPPDIYLAVGIFTQSIFDVVEQNTRNLTVLSELRRGYQSPWILWTDWTYGIPLYEIYLAARDHQYLLSATFIASWATVIYNVFLGSLQLSSSYYGATSFSSDAQAARATTFLMTFIILVSIVLGWRYCRPFLQRPPDTLAALIPYLIFSPSLREDVDAVRGTRIIEEKIRILEERGSTYAFGRFEVGQQRRLGVERRTRNLPEGGTTVKLI